MDTQNAAYVLLLDHYPSVTNSYKIWFKREGIPYRIANTALQTIQYKSQDLPALVIINKRLLHNLNTVELDKFSQHYLDSYILITEDPNDDIRGHFKGIMCAAQLSHPLDEKEFIYLVKTTLNMHGKRRFIKQHLANNKLTKDNRSSFHDFIGSSRSMQAVYQQIENAADSKASIFIKGESGTGKEVCANAIHQHSARANKPFIAINCAAIPKDLIESEIFGHVKGAFTGATSTRIGAAESADGGTLFLDELCEMDLNLQAKLLRFIQTGSFQKVGASQLQSVDIRFICATNRNPESEVTAGRFREDLFYRLHVIPIALPPLKDRYLDGLLIAHKLMAIYNIEEKKSFQDISPLAMQCMLNYTWPGNIRELQNVMRQIIVLNDDHQITKDMLPSAIQKACHSVTTAPINTTPTVQSTDDIEEEKHHVLPLWKEEKRIIERAIALCGGNIPKAAASLEVSASTIYRKKQAWQASSR